MVIYRGADGKPGYQQAEDIHDAVTFVEQMRNQEGVEQARIFRLEEVVFEYRPYYRVELSSHAHDHIRDVVLTNTGSSMPAMPNGVSLPVMPVSSLAADSADEPAVASLDEPFSVVESTTINVDDPDGEAVATNGARRGLFGR